ncbi:hypothetical protein VE00_09479 [Pseudogymnoascus sp. WSF 3629]|nr:hypothetical protein VE00_09479 [Pseudogymnoascus sp. WSF 3629]
MSAVCEEMLGRNDEGLYWDAARLHVIVLEQICKKDQDVANLSILHEIKEATTNGLEESIQYVNDLANRRPFIGKDVDDFLLKLWKWKAALAHGKVVNVYLGYGPYSTRSSGWCTTPAYHGLYLFDVERNAHFIHDDSGWLSFDDPNDNDIQARLAIIEEVRAGDNVNTNQATLA